LAIARSDNLSIEFGPRLSDVWWKNWPDPGHRRSNASLAGEIGPEAYTAKRAQLRDRQSGLRERPEAGDLDDREIAELAINAFELRTP
jgi:hypothetical protein